jgi:non-specific serine/threonine protein kinase
VERLRTEIDFLSEQLASAVGLGGRDRRAAGAAERARVNVTRAISDSVKRIREYGPRLARHLDASIRTGTFCSYAPPDPSDARWEL